MAKMKLNYLKRTVTKSQHSSTEVHLHTSSIQIKFKNKWIDNNNSFTDNAIISVALKKSATSSNECRRGIQ